VRNKEDSMADEAKANDVKARVIKVIAAQLEDVDESQIKMESDFIKDLGADSLDVVQLIIAMEEEFDLGEIPDEEAEKIRTVRDVVSYLMSQVA
jgi:acyl carrier protein